MTSQENDHAATLARLMLADPWRMSVLRQVSALRLPDCWVGAGFVRAAVWDHLHGRPPAPLTEGDIDVIWFDPLEATPAMDTAIEQRLKASNPSPLAWSVKNQAGMHLRNGDRPYHSATDAMSFWPETATAVAVRLNGNALEIAAPFGLDDLFALVLRPGPAFRDAKRPSFDARVRGKRWRERWPNLIVAA